MCQIPENRINKKVFLWDRNLALAGHRSWNKDVKSVFEKCDMLRIYENMPIMSKEKIKEVISTAKAKLMADYQEKWEKSVTEKTKLRTYMLVKPNMGVEEYVTKPIGHKKRSAFACMRMGVYPLRIETGRWRGKPLSERYCEQCNERTIECEHHFLLKCSKFNNQRDVMINKVIENFPGFTLYDDLEKLCYLLSDGYIETSKFIVSCEEYRI